MLVVGLECAQYGLWGQTVWTGPPALLLLDVLRNLTASKLQLPTDQGNKKTLHVGRSQT